MAPQHTSTRLPAGGKTLRRPWRHSSSSIGSTILSVLLAALAATCFAAGQESSGVQQPYAVINRQAINYSGPDREASRDLPGQEIKIGILAPLEGPRKAEGEAILEAARLASEEESATPFPQGRRLRIVARDEAGLWGRASSELVRLVIDDDAVALVTSTNGSAAHLAEQVGNRLSVPALALSSDCTTTQINIPWFFRLAPDDAAQAREFAENIYRHRPLSRVTLVTEPDHDGREGAHEFEKAMQRLGGPPPLHVEMDLSRGDVEPITSQIAKSHPQAIVLWTGPEAAARLLEEGGADLGTTPLYVCRKALSEPFLSAFARSRIAGWMVSLEGTDASAEADFATRYRARTGHAPSPAAAEVYDAVRLIAAGVRRTGPNRARLRDELAKTSGFRGVSGTITFDGAGNNQVETVLAKLGK